MAGRQDSTRRAPLRAFLIEDDVQALALLSDLAEMCGYEPVPFTRVSSARRALRDRVPRVIVVDDDLPDGRGADLVREVKDNPRTRHVRVVFCTAAEPERRHEMARLGPVIAKPFRVRDLERALSEAAAG